MSKTPSNNPEEIDLTCSGSCELHHWQEVDALTGETEIDHYWSVPFWILCISSLMTMVFAVSEDYFWTICFAGSTPTFCAMILYKIYQIKQRHSRQWERLAKQKSGWFAPTSWRFSDNGIDICCESEEETWHGSIKWSTFSTVKVAPNMVALFQDVPSRYFVFLSEWFATETEWDQFLKLIALKVPGSESSPDQV